MVAELFFGRTRVSEASWTRFLATEITPRFPDGLTVLEAKGQWRNPTTKAIARERSTVVTIAMPPARTNDARLQQIVEAYKTRFKQPVGRADRAAGLRVVLGRRVGLKELPVSICCAESSLTPNFWTLRAIFVPGLGIKISQLFILHLIHLGIKLGANAVRIPVIASAIVADGVTCRPPIEREAVTDQQIGSPHKLWKIFHFKGEMRELLLALEKLIVW